LVSGQPKTGLHALERGIDSRLRPTLHEFSVRGLLIALGDGNVCECGNKEAPLRQSQQLEFYEECVP
jgi:hypothetical protein